MGIKDLIKNLVGSKEQKQEEKESEKQVSSQPSAFEEQRQKPIGKCDQCGGPIFDKSERKRIDQYTLHKRCYRKMKQKARKNAGL